MFNRRHKVKSEATEKRKEKARKEQRETRARDQMEEGSEIVKQRRECENEKRICCYYEKMECVLW